MAHHGVRFPRARLAIGKNAGIETFKCSFQDIRPQVMKNLKQEKKKKRKRKVGQDIIEDSLIDKNKNQDFHLHI